ncbi:MAG: hypothetical protein NTW32_07770 [Chloroflexi bacterium]|nr:hypothetical protein [Chloroflexota bacterium]
MAQQVFDLFALGDVAYTADPCLGMSICIPQEGKTIIQPTIPTVPVFKAIFHMVSRAAGTGHRLANHSINFGLVIQVHQAHHGFDRQVFHLF